MNFLYLDTCAAIKLFQDEVESEVLKSWLVRHAPARQITSHLTRTELRRGLYASDADAETHQRAEQWLHRCAHVALPAKTFDDAGTVLPGTRLRSLDAVHVTAALSLGAALVRFVTYDKRMIAAAEEAGLPVAAPG
ncbi:type II toxin-antitoxin system VapC family toxin [Haloechinothrix sp. YIM 98757]|uniref:Ribonuclease VapC n=1 Tax=Haloechinothrix aidingensis TaxID=2752311 RepID=A0A838ABF6_9PSEU|nr:type II toxin-antitoxin system VapC family toxin [Haloechinothrix aidingensis]